MDETTQLLLEAGKGDQRSLDRLLPRVYDELHALAQGMMAREAPEHTLQPTALVHEAYLKLIDQSRASWNDRVHFLAIATQVIRRILIDHARAKSAQKRGGGAARHQLGDWLATSFETGTNLVELDDSLNRFAESQPRAARIVELRVFGGLTNDEAAAVVGVSVSTVEREWRLARATLYRELCDD